MQECLGIGHGEGGNDESKGEEREGYREESLGVGHRVVDVNGLVVDEFKAREAECPSGILSGALDAARNIAPPLPPPLVVVLPTSSNDERKDEEREGDREESQEIGHGEGVSGLIVKFNAREAGCSSSELSGAVEAARQIAPPLLPPLVVVPPTSNEERKGEERKGDREESQGIGHGEGVSGLIVDEFSSSELSGAMEKDVLRRYSMLPENAKIDQIKATMEKDVLTVTVSKGRD